MPRIRSISSSGQGLVGLARGDDQVRGELHLAEEVGVLERDVELVVQRAPSRTELPDSRHCPHIQDCPMARQEQTPQYQIDPFG